jgi:hypothetical protein
MNTHLIKEADLPNVAQNALATMNIGNTFNHHGLWLEFTKAAGVAMTEAEIETDVEYVSVYVKQRGGDNIPLLRKIPPAQIFDLMNRYREASRSGYTYAGGLFIPYVREDLNILVNPWALVIGMLDIETYTLHVKFNDVVLTTVLVGVIPEVDKQPLRPLGEHIRFERWERNNATGGIEAVHDLPYGEPGTAMLAYHIYDAVAAITNVEVKLDGDLIYTDLSDAQNDLILHRSRRTPQTNTFSVDFNRTGGVLPVGQARAFRHKWTWSAAPDGYDVYTDMIYNLGAKNYV